MKFYLFKNHEISMSSGHDEIITVSHFSQDGFSKYLMITTSVIPVENNNDQREKCSKLKKMLEEHASTTGIDLGAHAQMQSWSLDLLIGVQNPEHVVGNKLRGYVKLQGIFAGNCLDGLGEIGRDNVCVQIHLASPTGVLQTKEMPIKESNCEDLDMEFPVAHFRSWKSQSYYAMCTVAVTIPDELVTGIYKKKPKVSPDDNENANENRPINQRILEGEILSDVSLVANNGVAIKAHRNFLAVHSSVFLAMFESGMEESRERTVEIPDMTEDSVRAFLKYLYFEDTTAANESSLVAFELFHAAHKYDIGKLEKLMKELILGKPSDWFDVDVTVKIFIFARKLTPVDELLKKKAIKVLKTCFDKLEESPSYRELFEKDKKGAMELCKYAFAT